MALTGSGAMILYYDIAPSAIATEWTARMMKHFRGMARSFFRVAAGSGLGLGYALRSVRHVPISGTADEIREWLNAAVSTAISTKPGVDSAWMLEPAATPPMTQEQAIRGKDADLPCVLLMTGYDMHPLSRIFEDELRPEQFERHGALADAIVGTYRLDYPLTASECASRARGRGVDSSNVISTHRKLR